MNLLEDFGRGLEAICMMTDTFLAHATHDSGSDTDSGDDAEQKRTLIDADYAYLFKQHLKLEDQYNRILEELRKGNPDTAELVSDGGLKFLSGKIQDSFRLIFRFILTDYEEKFMVLPESPLFLPEMKPKPWFKSLYKLHWYNEYEKQRVRAMEDNNISEQREVVNELELKATKIRFETLDLCRTVDMELRKSADRLEGAYNSYKKVKVEIHKVKKEMKRNKETSKIEFELHEEMMKQSNSVIVQGIEQELDQSNMIHQNVEKQQQETINALKKELRIIKIEKERVLNEYDNNMIKLYKTTKKKRTLLEEKTAELNAVEATKMELFEERQEYMKLWEERKEVTRERRENEVKYANILKKIFQRKVALSKEKATMTAEEALKAYESKSTTDKKRRLVNVLWEAYKRKDEIKDLLEQLWTESLQGA